jgi:hypothetical protein
VIAAKAAASFFARTRAAAVAAAKSRASKYAQRMRMRARYRLARRRMNNVRQRLRNWRLRRLQTVSRFTRRGVTRQRHADRQQRGGGLLQRVAGRIAESAARSLGSVRNFNRDTIRQPGWGLIVRPLVPRYGGSAAHLAPPI